MPISTTRPFLIEQEALRRPAESLLIDAAKLPAMSLERRIDVIERAVAYVSEVLLPHTRAHEQVVCATIDRLLGEGQTDAYAHDRELIRERIADLVDTDPADVARIQELLYALHLLVTGSLDREAESYLRLAKAAPAGGVERLLERVARYERAMARIGPA